MAVQRHTLGDIDHEAINEFALSQILRFVTVDNQAYTLSANVLDTKRNRGLCLSMLREVSEMGLVES